MQDVCNLPPDLVVGATSDTARDLWHLPRLLWESIWGKVTGQGIKVAILDTGYTAHPDLPEPVASRSFIRGESVTDGNGHGNHCAGTSIGRNGIGVAPDADLVVAKVLSNRGSGGSDGIAAAVRWAVDSGADVVSMSLGGGGYFEPMIRALEYAEQYGVIVNSAAGNSGFNGSTNTIGYPAKYEESLCCGAYRSDGRIAGFSSGGRQMDWANPGQDIVSASHRGSGYVSMSGTSMATPFGSGVLALILELARREGHPGFKNLAGVRDFLKQYSDDAGAPGFDPSFGHGIPKANAIIEALAADDVTLLSDEGPTL